MKSYLVESCGALMRYHDFEGDKTPIIMIHGLGCAGSFDYPEVAACKVLKGHRIILVDLLGAGFSDKPLDFEYSVSAHAAYLETFIADMGFKQIIIFGHSLGGAVAIELAARCERILERLILSESNLDPSGEGATSRFIAMQACEDFISEGYFKLIEKSRQTGNEMWAAVLASWLPKATHDLSVSAVKGGSPSWREVLYGLKKPKTFIYGEWTLPDPDESVLKAQGIDIKIVHNAGHSMAWENSKGLAEAIANSICQD